MARAVVVLLSATAPLLHAQLASAQNEPGQKDQVRTAWDDIVAPAVRANGMAFQRAFGDSIRVIELDVPFVTGYEYMSAPDMIEPHIRRFLAPWAAAQSGGAEPPVSARSYTGPIIDMHLHSYSAADYWGASPSPATGRPAPASAVEHMEQSIEVMRRYNVVLGAASGEALASAAAWWDHDPDRVLRGVMLEDPAKSLAPDAFRSLAERGELDVLGEVGAQYVGLSPSDPAYSPYWAIAQEHGIPVAIHTGASFPGMPYRGRPDFRLRYGNPLLLEDMLVEFADLKVYMMHAGGAGPYSEYGLMMMNMYPQLYVDVGVLSWMPGLEGVLERFLRQTQAMGMLNRVMFGSDQMVWPEAIGLAVERIDGLDFLSQEEKAGIFYGNAARFLGLDDETIARHHDRATRPYTRGN